MDPNSLREWSKNPKQHDAANVQTLARSLRRFGFVAPVVVWGSEKQIVAGHGRCRAALLLLKADPGAYLAIDAPGPGLIPVRVVEFASASEADMYAIQDNRSTEANPMDPSAIAEILRELDAEGEEIEIPAYSDAEIESMLGKEEPDGTGGTDEGAPEVQDGPPDSVAGGVYELGPHRLVCGDSRDTAAWGRLLLDGERLQMIWTDPPYGVSVQEKNDHLKNWDGRSNRPSQASAVTNDSLSIPELTSFLSGVFTVLLSVCQPGAAWYVASPGMRPLGVFAAVLGEVDVWRHTLLWVKDSFVLGRADYHYRHEIIFYGWAPGAAHYWCGRRDVDSVFEIPRPKASSEHPTMKPVELVEFCINNSSKTGWVVGEPFGGSGTTLIACAKTGRIARLIEIDPRYCDVIRRRWTRYALSAGVDPGPGRLGA
jgi:DNA modification methylase